ncbi:hypothetical protein NBRC10513_005936 [Rhodotorula toruloides]|uniref:BY PROTMAP: gi/647394473/emb/CDR35703.1/ RHTO0S01e05248g1_1 [Rhodosporidium toruloides] n=1 Tax=Rhodotorula toruloides TaxID=5286 RepID=A0A0K3CKG2_RHOTO|nr:hypothetical protein AAT19DRAFT_9451 [Rhodotorula toruloides]
MPKGLTYASFTRAVGELCPGGRSSLAHTKPGRLWKDGIFFVASETWFLALSRVPDFGARSEDIRARLKADRLRVQRVADSVVDQPDGLTLALLAETLIGKKTYDQAVGVGEEKDDPQRLGMEYGKLIADVAIGPTSNKLDSNLSALRCLAEADGHAWYHATWLELRDKWVYLSSTQRSFIIWRCQHALEHLDKYKFVDKLSTQELVRHLPTAAALLGAWPLIEPHDRLYDCPTCAAEYEHVQARHALGHPASSPFFPRARSAAARQMRAF